MVVSGTAPGADEFARAVEEADADSVLVIPRANPLKPHTMGSIIQASGITVDEFKDLL